MIEDEIEATAEVKTASVSAMFVVLARHVFL